ncbi:MAG TPA: carotenoid oxygenase family protein [Candidatus Binatia bacterium]|jgi:carotenoid cleavage dioxygenase
MSTATVAEETSASLEKLPFFLRGNYAPVETETSSTSLSVDGAIPTALVGTYLRNGPNPKGTTPPHWFFGDGMLHGVALESGKALWYRNRWIRTKQLTDRARVVQADGSRDLAAGPANTNIVRHAGRILALAETTRPWEISPGLETVGNFDFGGRLTTGMTAHPKICPQTGEMHFFDYNWFSPFLTYHCTDASGALVRSVPIDVPGPTMMHDFAITSGHVLFMDLPVVFDFERAMRGQMPYRWDDAYGARIGVMKRGDDSGAVRWFDVAPCYVFHPMNAFETGDRITIDVARYPELWREGTARFDLAYLHRWEIDLGRGSVTESALDDRPIEFPRIDDRLCGSKHRYGYAVRNLSSRDSAATSLLKYDLAGGVSVEHDFGSSRFPGEAVFAPDPSSGEEDAGWLLAYVYDAATDRSDLVILDARDFAGPSVAEIHLPCRIPFGFHGNWMPA